MKVGILTFHRGPNYGGFLQAWSLREAIRGMGHDVEIINYKNRKHFELECFRWRLTLRVGQMLKQWRKFRMWEKAYEDLVPGRVVHEAGDIEWDRYDAVVVGSDVVWDYEKANFGSDPVYFGVVPGRGPGQWISYAASCGKADPHGLPREKAEGMKRFAAFGVRDEGTHELVHHVTGRDAKMVLDPTWLVEEEEPVALEATDPVLAVYSYARMEKHTVDKIHEFARRHELEIVAYGFNKVWADRDVLDLPPFDWVESLRRARCMVTGTFHGTLYALRLGKVFCTVGNEWIANKISAPLKMLEVEDRLVGPEGDPAAVLEKQIDEQGGSLYPKTRLHREASLDFLKRSLAPAAPEAAAKVADPR